MSKSLGNSPEPLELIKKYGADGVRVGMLLSSPAGNDLLFDESLCEQQGPAMANDDSRESGMAPTVIQGCDSALGPILHPLSERGSE